MSEEEKLELVPINVDGRDAQVPSGSNLVDALEHIGVEIPHYCYHPKLSVSGNCRMCLIEMGTPGRDRATGEPLLNEDGSPRIMWVPKPVIACATKVSPGMHVRTDSPSVRSCREGVMEFLLVNHPLDCPICDQAGECRLQEFAADYGRGFSRFVEHKNVKPKRTRIGPRVILDDERCILCSRCIRFCEEIAEDPVLGFIDRGSYSTLTTFPGHQLANNYSLNTVDICPVGALTSVDFRFKMRVWFLKETPSIDTESSTGCNTVVGSREGIIYRITPRRNDAVNDTWMPDSGRELYKRVDSENRLVRYSVDGRPVDPGIAIDRATEILKAGHVAIVGSGRLSVEEQFLLQRIRESLGDVPVHIPSHLDTGDGKLLSADRSPNTRGALLTGLTQSLPRPDLSDLADSITRGEVRTVLAVGEDVVEAGISKELIDKIDLIYAGCHHNECVQYSAVELPMLTVFEKSGSFVNQQFRLQKFEQAVPGPDTVLPGLGTLAGLLARLDGEAGQVDDMEAIWEALSAAVPEFSGIAFETIPETGMLLDSGRFSKLTFPEGEGLHYKPELIATEA